jgi:hypothetical protein
MHIAKLIFVCLLLSVSVSYAAEPGVSASAVAEMMKQAKYSDGFEARLNVLITKANGAHPAPFKLAVIGQFTANRQRLQIRGISPELVRNHLYAAERSSDGLIRAVEARNKVADDYAGFDPLAKMFNSSLVAWDMFSPWWSWPRQSFEGLEQVNGRECVKIRSLTDDKSSAVREVESCVDQHAKLALRTRLFDSEHSLLRTTTAAQLARKGDGGAMMAKKINITDAANTVTEIEVYAGDEQYQISAETFAMLGRPTRNEQREAR